MCAKTGQALNAVKFLGTKITPHPHELLGLRFVSVSQESVYWRLDPYCGGSELGDLEETEPA